jgi:6-phosphogluconate dehydrogenase
MELGMIGLGRMGGNMTQRLMERGHQLVVYDPLRTAVAAQVNKGALGATSITDLTDRLKKPRAVWLMVPSGKPTQETIDALSLVLSPGDVVVDGGNSYYKDSVKRAAELRSKKIMFLDAGTSGGVWGLREGYSLMIGGDREAYDRLEPAIRALAPSADGGYGHVGPAGAGHFVKMVHNGIEYGLMQAYAEGFELMQAKSEFDLDLKQVAEIWRHGSVVRSWLLDLAARALEEDPRLQDLQSYVEDSGEGRWTVMESIELAVPIPVISQALQVRFRSRQPNPFGARLLAALRQQFGGHPVKKTGRQ